MTRAAQLAGLGSLEGSAPAYACRAWVNFNGTGTPAISASGNVSSISDYGVGHYGINLANALPDQNYSISAISDIGGWNSGVNQVAGLGTTGYQVRFWDKSNTSADPALVTTTIHR